MARQLNETFVKLEHDIANNGWSRYMYSKMENILDHLDCYIQCTIIEAERNCGLFVYDVSTLPVRILNEFNRKYTF